MMLINLTSPIMKNELKLRAIFIMVRTIIITLIILAAVFCLANLVGINLLKSKADNLTLEVEKTKLLNKPQGQSTVSDQIKLINSEISILQNIQKRYVNWSSIISKFSALIPRGIDLSAINIDQKTQTLTFTGTANTRDTYIQYEQILQKSDLISNVMFPLQTKKTNLSFSITATLKNVPKP
jgi:hypothetical protein